MDKSEIAILVVDDENVVSANLTAYLEDDGFTVFSVASGEGAIALLIRKKMDIGIIDMRLPGIDGNELILRAHEMQPQMKFLIHTGSTNYALPQSLISIGLAPRHVFRKPLSDLSVLSRAVKKLIFGDVADD